MRKLLLLVAVVALAVSCSKQQAEANEVKSYDLLCVMPSDYTITTEYAASIKGLQDIRIIPRIEGYLQEVLIKEGERVREGQVLFRIESVAYQAAVETAAADVAQTEAALEKARLEYTGKIKLHEKGIVSDYDLATTKSELSIAEANHTAAEAALKSARNNLSYTELRSPSNGVVGRIYYRKGDYVGPTMQDGLTIVTENEKMRVYFSMTEKMLMEKLHNHQTMQEVIHNMPEVSLRLSNNSIYDQKGRIESISGIVDKTTGSVSVCALFENKNGILLSGGTGKVLLPTVWRDIMVIPQQATYEILNQVYVMKLVNSEATPLPIQVDALNDGKEYVVLEGLSVGDTIIARGAAYVQAGTKVQSKTAE